MILWRNFLNSKNSIPRSNSLQLIYFNHMECWQTCRALCEVVGDMYYRNLLFTHSVLTSVNIEGAVNHLVNHFLFDSHNDAVHRVNRDRRAVLRVVIIFTIFSILGGKWKKVYLSALYTPYLCIIEHAVVQSSSNEPVRRRGSFCCRNKVTWT